MPGALRAATCCNNLWPQVFDMIETQMVRHNISNALPMRILYRSLYVVIVAFVGVRLLCLHHRLQCMHTAGVPCSVLIL